MSLTFAETPFILTPFHWPAMLGVVLYRPGPIPLSKGALRRAVRSTH